jgi:hypothetical protein
MDRVDEIDLAANEALSELRIDNVAFSQAVRHTTSRDFNPETWSIYFRECDGRYFRVVVDTVDVHRRCGSITVDSLREEIKKKLNAEEIKDCQSVA